jgi:hypothetical protein
MNAFVGETIMILTRAKKVLEAEAILYGNNNGTARPKRVFRVC